MRPDLTVVAERVQVMAAVTFWTAEVVDVVHHTTGCVAVATVLTVAVNVALLGTLNEVANVPEAVVVTVADTGVVLP